MSWAGNSPGQRKASKYLEKEVEPPIAHRRSHAGIVSACLDWIEQNVPH